VQPLRSDDPRRIGSYAVRHRLGSGAMGTVYLGFSPGGRAVAVKVARDELADDPEFRERFRREVEMARTVGGFWTAAVVDADPSAPRPWLATEYVPGPSLQQAVAEQGPLPETVVRRLAAGLAEALVAIHAAGLVHRDLKPSNVLLGPDGPRVIDFGISQALECAKLTATGIFLGTPGFLSPEQISGGEIGPASDVFSLGAVLVYAATGRGPFGDGQTSVLMYRALHNEPDLDDVPAGLREMVSRCLRRDPAERPGPAALLAELADTGNGQPAVESERRSWLPDRLQTVVDGYVTRLRNEAATSGVTTADSDTPARALPATKPYTQVIASESPAARVVQPPGPTNDGLATPGLGGSAGALRVHPNGSSAAGSPAPPPTPKHPAYHAPSSGGVRFGLSRVRATVSGIAALVGGLTAGGIADDLGEGGVALVALVVCVVLLVMATRFLILACRSPISLEVSSQGLVLTKGRGRWDLPWHAVNRARVVQHGKKAWLIVWLTPGWMVPKTVGGWSLRPYHGGIRLFPIAPGRRRKQVGREIRELRAALAWHAPQVFDRSP